MTSNSTQEGKTLPDSTAVVGVPDELAELSARARKLYGDLPISASLCDTGVWMVSTLGDSICFGDPMHHADEEEEPLRLIADLLNAVRAQPQAIASRSTQPEGEAGLTNRPPDARLKAQVRSPKDGLSAFTVLAASTKLLPQPEAAASGDVAEILNGLVSATVCYAASSPSVQRTEDFKKARRNAETAIRALIPQPSTPAGEVPNRKCMSLREMTDAELAAADLDYQEREKGDWEGGGSTRETFYERWSDIVEELHRRGLNAPSDTKNGTPHRVSQPEPGSMQGGEAR